MLTKRVHNYTINATTRQVQLVETKPYIRLSQRDHGSVYLQAGGCFADAGEAIELPEWAAEQMRLLSDAALKEVQWERPAASEWTCDTCGEAVALTVKGVHIASHRREKKGN